VSEEDTPDIAPYNEVATETDGALVVDVEVGGYDDTTVVLPPPPPPPPFCVIEVPPTVSVSQTIPPLTLIPSKNCPVAELYTEAISN
jgi:hypothetical protein